MINSFFFRKANIEDAALIQSLLEAAPTYLLNIEGYLAPMDAAVSTITNLPPQKDFSPDKKYVHVIYHNEKPVGVTDCLDGYPDADTLYIGLFLLIESEQKKGIGKMAYKAYEQFLRASFSCKKFRLAVVENNPVLGFWLKQGFSLTGEKKDYESGLVKSFSLLMEKKNFS